MLKKCKTALVRGLLIGSLAFATVFSFQTPAYAYLDPGTGSMILQILLGGVAGALVIGKLYWSKFKSMFTSSSTSVDEPQDTSNTDK